MSKSHYGVGSMLLGCCLLIACGRKQRTIFDFDPPKKVKINKLSLPAVKGISCSHEHGKIVTLSWHELHHKHIIGYNVYCGKQGHAMCKQPINKSPLQAITFSCKTKPDACYLVRGVFVMHDQTVEGPASQLCCNK